VTLRVGGKVHQGRTTNVSRGGLAAELPGPLANGAEIECELQLVFDDDAHSEPLSVPARIVWCTALEDVFQVGVAFKPMTADKAQFLTIFLRYLDDSGPNTKPPKIERSIDDQFR
jgi:PilZ domain-containing protein